MTDDELNALLAHIKDSPLFGADFCQYHPQFYAGFKGPIHKMDSSHHLSAVKDGERMRLGEFQHAEWAGYLQVCANAAPTLAAEVLALRAVDANRLETLNHMGALVERLESAEAALSEARAYATVFQTVAWAIPDADIPLPATNETEKLATLLADFSAAILAASGGDGGNG